MSVLNVDEISNPDIRLDQTSIEPVVQIFREVMFVQWVPNFQKWPAWAVQIRYGPSDIEDPLIRFHKSTKMLELHIASLIKQFRIDDIDGQFKHLVLSLFDDVLVNMSQQELGTMYFIYNRQTCNLVMQVCFTNLGV